MMPLDDEEAELETVPELEPAGTPPLEDGDAELETAPELEPAGTPLVDDAEAEFDGTPLADDEVEYEAELDGTRLLDDEPIVTVELLVRVMVLNTVLVVVAGEEEPLPVTGLLSVPWECGWEPDEPLPAGPDGALVETVVRVSGHSVVVIAVTAVTTEPEAGQSVTEDAQPKTVT
jgi:hypothetical protein